MADTPGSCDATMMWAETGAGHSVVHCELQPGHLGMHQEGTFIWQCYGGIKERLRE